MVALEIMVPTPAIRNLIREDKVHQIYSSMQTGQEKLGMQTLNQSLATLYLSGQITIEAAMTASSLKEELTEMINRGTGVVPGAGLGRGGAVPVRRSVAQRNHIMATFAFSGRTRGGPAGQRRTRGGQRRSRRSPCCGASRSASSRSSQVKAKDEGRAKAGQGRAGRGVPTKNLAIFTRQFSVMIDAGLPLVQCLDILGKQEAHKGFSATILKTREDVEGGASLADAMRRHPKTFDALYTNMVAAGEAGGILDTILKRLATYIEKNVRLKAQVKSAMIYPIAVMIIAARRRRRHPVEGHPDLRPAVRRPRRRAAAADAHRHLDEQLARPLHAVHDRRHRRAGRSLLRQYYATYRGRRVIDGAAAARRRCSA